MLTPELAACRAEQSFTHRHMCEFTGLDFEMEIHEHYNEVLDVLGRLFIAIFKGLQVRYGELLGLEEPECLSAGLHLR